METGTVSWPKGEGRLASTPLDPDAAVPHLWAS